MRMRLAGPTETRSSLAALMAAAFARADDRCTKGSGASCSRAAAGLMLTFGMLHYFRRVAYSEMAVQK